MNPLSFTSKTEVIHYPISNENPNSRLQCPNLTEKNPLFTESPLISEEPPSDIPGRIGIRFNIFLTICMSDSLIIWCSSDPHRKGTNGNQSSARNSLSQNIIACRR